MAIVSALAFTAVGMGAGVASADPPLPNHPGVTCKLDRGGHGHGYWDWDDGGWNGSWQGPGPCGAGYWVPAAVWQWAPPAAWER